MKFLGETVVPEGGHSRPLTRDLEKHLDIVDPASHGLDPFKCVRMFCFNKEGIYRLKHSTASNTSLFINQIPCIPYLYPICLFILGV